MKSVSVLRGIVLGLRLISPLQRLAQAKLPSKSVFCIP